MNKKSIVGFAVLLMSVILSSCNSESESVTKKDSIASKEESVISSTEVTQTVTELTTVTDFMEGEVSLKEEQLKNDNQIESNDVSENRIGSYDISVDTIEASSIYNTEIVSLPESINDKSYFLCDINNDNIVVSVDIVDEAEEYICEYGLLNPKDNSYETLITNKKDTYYSCSCGDYYVFTSYQNDVDSLEYYNAQTKENNIIFNYIDGFTVTENVPIIYDGKLYFDVYTTPNRDYVDLYEYDFTNGELLKKVENATIPMISSSGLKYVNFDYYGDGADKIVAFSDKSEFSILNKRLMELTCVEDRVFGFVNEETGHKYGDITKFQQLSENEDDITILSTISGEGELLTSLVTNDFCVAWNDETGLDSTPCTYDFLNNRIVVFDNMENCYYRTFLQSDMGMIFDIMNFNQTHQVCLFSPKED